MRVNNKLRLIEGGRGTDGMVMDDRNKAAYQDVTPADRAAKGILIMAHGNHSAAHLIRKFRKAFHKTGMMEFELPRKKGIPRWFWVGIEYLKAERRETWVVTERVINKTRTFRVRWKHWGTWKRSPSEVDGYLAVLPVLVS